MDLTRLLPTLEGEATAVIRTDFSDHAAWAAVVEALSRPIPIDDGGDDDFGGNLNPINDPEFAGLTAEALATELEPLEVTAYVILADGRSMVEAQAAREITVDYIDFSGYAREDAEMFETFFGRTFRCEAGEVGSIEVNLAIANMDFHEFADDVDADGVFRGFE